MHDTQYGCAGGPYGTLRTAERSIATLSGGERQRVALALSLAFTDVAAQRGRMRCNLLVLDEVPALCAACPEPAMHDADLSGPFVQVMQNLDAEGCSRVAALLRGLRQETILLVAQADTPTAQARCCWLLLHIHAHAG